MHQTTILIYIDNFRSTLEREKNISFFCNKLCKQSPIHELTVVFVMRQEIDTDHFFFFFTGFLPYFAFFVVLYLTCSWNWHPPLARPSWKSASSRRLVFCLSWEQNLFTALLIFVCIRFFRDFILLVTFLIRTLITNIHSGKLH